MQEKEFFESILKLASTKKYPDIHFNTWHFPILRWHTGELFPLEKLWEINLEELTKEKIIEFIKIMVWEEWLAKFIRNKELDSSISIEWADRYRVNCYMDTAWYSIALRIIPAKIPTMEELWLWEQIKEMCRKNKWLILLTWPTWSWKSTNIAAMLDYINNNFKKHIITIEDPVEFTFESKLSLINQREVGSNTHGFTEAMRSVLREDPDVIVVWEMRDPETIKTAITLAETWHLVLSTLHTNDSVQTIDRMVDIFPWSQQKQIRMQLSQSLIWVISQKLIAREDKEWRIAAREILMANDAVKNLIIEWKTHQLYSVLEVWQNSWMILMDRYLIALYKRNVISKDSLLSYARDKEWVEMLIN